MDPNAPRCAINDWCVRRQRRHRKRVDGSYTHQPHRGDCTRTDTADTGGDTQRPDSGGVAARPEAARKKRADTADTPRQTELPPRVWPNAQRHEVLGILAGILHNAAEPTYARVAAGVAWLQYSDAATARDPRELWEELRHELRPFSGN